METYTICGNQYTRGELMRLGESVAEIWGGVCVGVKVDMKKNDVIFLCKEHGEEFVSSMPFHEIEDELKALDEEDA